MRQEFSGFPMARWIVASTITFQLKNIVTSFNTNDAENVLRIIGTYIYHGFPKLKSTF